MHSTKNDLPETTRTKMCEILNARLADAIDLGLQAKQAHWNVKGPAFYALHKLFDEVADGRGDLPAVRHRPRSRPRGGRRAACASTSCAGRRAADRRPTGAR